jgi:hypothetical protein
MPAASGTIAAMTTVVYGSSRVSQPGTAAGRAAAG